MTGQDDTSLTGPQLEAFRTALDGGAAEASLALSRWIHKTATVSLDAVEQLPLHEATSVLGVRDEPICFCVAEVTGRLAGELILAFDDASGLALADMLLDYQYYNPQDPSPYDDTGWSLGPMFNEQTTKK